MFGTQRQLKTLESLVCWLMVCVCTVHMLGSERVAKYEIRDLYTCVWDRGKCLGNRSHEFAPS